MIKSIGVVLGSYVLSILLVLATDPLLSMIFPGQYVRDKVPPDKVLMVSTACFMVISILCAWVCGRFAPGKAGKHVLAFFIIGEVMGVVTSLPNWNKGWPHWYFLSWLLSWPITCYIGLLLSGRAKGEPSSPPNA
jgi:hypothetical protein